MLYQNQDEYYVLVKNKKDENEQLLNTLITTAKEKKNIKLYYTYLDDVFNKQFVSETSNLVEGPTTAIKFKITTLVHVKNKKAVNYYEGKDKIVEKLTEMSK
jgi:hypothetical protein